MHSNTQVHNAHHRDHAAGNITLFRLCSLACTLPPTPLPNPGSNLARNLEMNHHVGQDASSREGSKGQRRPGPRCTLLGQQHPGAPRGGHVTNSRRTQE